MQNFKKIKKIFFVGIGGIGTSALARLFSAQGGPASGWKVSGSDKYRSEITDDLKKQGVKVFIGHKEKNLDLDVDLLIYSPAIRPEIPERRKAEKFKIKQLSYPEALSLISKDKYTIAISGTHGKSTTTAILGLILGRAKFDPTVIVGSKVGPFNNSNLRIGKSKYFVVEACEWRAHMLELRPKIIILNNIEEDHLDYYKNLKNIKEAFKEYVSRLPKDGLLIINADDSNCLEVAKSTRGRVITYGIDNQKVDCRATNIKTENKLQKFSLIWQNKNLGIFSLRVPGKFNIYNALAASACTLKLKIKPEIIRKTLSGFKGIWRRFEKIGEYKGALIFTDYAHHPTALKETLKAAKEFYPTRRLLIAYQPHHFDRTKRLFDKFITAFDRADLIILNEIYDVPGRETFRDISSKDLVRELKKRGLNAFYTKNLIETKKLLLQNINRNDIVLIVGAGDIYRLSTIFS